jgi:DNA-binding CsgD family transcriptional regulator
MLDAGVSAPLDARERVVLAHVLQGNSLKLVSLELGLSPASVSRLRKCALEKLGFASVFELMHAHATSLRGSGVGRMTRAEREVAEAVLAGCSNASIAKKRGTSSRTVANQLARLYRKLKVGSRLELAARLLRPRGMR